MRTEKRWLEEMQRGGGKEMLLASDEGAKGDRRVHRGWAKGFRGWAEFP
jgi:hypothetical protein